MLNASSLHLSLAGSPAEQLKAIVSFIDQLAAGSYQTEELRDIRNRLTSPEAQALTAEEIDWLVWRELQSELPPHLEFEPLDEKQLELSVQPNVDIILDEAKPSLGYVHFITKNEAWPEDHELAPKVKCVFKDWWESCLMEMFDRATRRVVWTYTVGNSGECEAKDERLDGKPRSTVYTFKIVPLAR